MATLKEAVESGRRIRQPGKGYAWLSPNKYCTFSLAEAVATDWEIEPAKLPPKSVEGTLCAHFGLVTLIAGSGGSGVKEFERYLDKAVRVTVEEL